MSAGNSRTTAMFVQSAASADWLTAVCDRIKTFSHCDKLLKYNDYFPESVGVGELPAYNHKDKEKLHLRKQNVNATISFGGTFVNKYVF